MPHAVLLWVSSSRCSLATQSFIFFLIGWIYFLSRACGWISWLCCVLNHHVFFISWKVRFAFMRKARQSSSGLESGVLIFRWPWEPTGTWSTFFNCAIWIISHPAHKPFQDTAVSKSSNETPESVDCSEPSFINDEAHGFGIVADSRFGVVSTKASVSSVTGNSLHLEGGLVAVPPFFLESPWRVEFYRRTDLYLGQKSSSRIGPCKEKPGLKLPTGHALDGCRAAPEVPVDLGFPISLQLQGIEWSWWCPHTL